MVKKTRPTYLFVQRAKASRITNNDNNLWFLAALRKYNTGCIHFLFVKIIKIGFKDCILLSMSALVSNRALGRLR